MKLIVICYLLLQNSAFAFFECNKEKVDKLNFNSIDILYGDMAPIIRSSINQVIQEYKKAEKAVVPKNTYIVAEINGQRTPIVFGLTEKQVLEMDADPNGEACSNNHNRNDFSNRWCHAYFVKLISETAKMNGISNFAAAMMGASIFVVKEYAIDLHPSKPDLVIADYQIYKSKNNSDLLTGTIFGDGMIFINYQKKF